MQPIKFAQISDLHLEARLSTSGLQFTQTQAEQRRAEVRQTLVQFVETARKEQVDLVLLPGDLTDTPVPSPETVNFLIDTLNQLHPIPTLIAPGNHDCASAASFYNPASVLYRSRGAAAPTWGEHIYIFRGENYETVQPLPDRSLTVTGCAFTEHVSRTSNWLSKVPAPAGDVSILLIHGSLLGQSPTPHDEPQVAPFTAEDLANLGYTYVALGHYHSMSLVRSAGRIVGAYAGSPVALALNATGPKGFIIGCVVPGQPLKQEDLRLVPADCRQIRPVALDVTGLSHQTAFEMALEKALTTSGASPADIVVMRLTGRHPPGVRFRVPERLRKVFWHTVIADETWPDYDLQLEAPIPAGPAVDVADCFRRRMQQIFQSATSDEEREVIREAYIYGCDALTLGKVTLR